MTVQQEAILRLDDYQKFRFSITCHTQDLAVLHCLRALCQWAEQNAKPQIGWGGTTEKTWKRSGGKCTLRFTSSEYRQRFIAKAEQLLPNRWNILETNDQNPAERQRPPH